MKLKQTVTALLLTGSLLVSPLLLADNYVLDTKGAHAFIQFRIKHLGYSWLYGRFNQFKGEFSYDEAAPEKSSVSVKINTASVDSNHAERDKHLRGKDFLNTDKYPEAKFVSTAYQPSEDGKGTLTGDLTLNGVTRPITIAVEQIGAGKDPWGGFRRGFQGSTSFALKDFDINRNLGPASTDVEIILSVEGIRQ